MKCPLCIRIFVVFVALAIMYGPLQLNAQSTKLTQIHKKGMELMDRGEYAKAIPYAKKAIKLTKSEYGIDSIQLADRITELAYLNSNQGSYDEATTLYKQALQIKKNKLGSNHPDVVEILNWSGMVLQRQGRFDKAELVFKKGLSIKQVPADLRTDLIGNLALIYHLQGRLFKAEPLYLEALKMSPPKDQGHKRFNLGSLYQSQARYAEAESMFEQALVLNREKYGSDHPFVASMLNGIGFLYKVLGRYEESETKLRQSLEIREKTLGFEHPDVGISLNNLAGLYDAQVRFDKSIPLYKRALLIKKKSLGSNHPSVAIALYKVGKVHFSEGDIDRAEKFFKEAMAIDKEIYGQESYQFGEGLSWLSIILRERGHLDKAQGLLKRVLKINERLRGPRHTETAYTLKDLGHLYKKMERHDDAEALYLRSLEIFEDRFGENHSNLIPFLSNVVALYVVQGKYQKAWDISKRAAVLARNKLQNVITQDSEPFGVIVALWFHLDLALNPSQIGDRAQLEDQAYQSLQLGRKSSAAGAIARMSARFRTGDQDIAGLIRDQQDARQYYVKLDERLIKAIGEPTDKQSGALLANLRKNIKTMASQIVFLDREIEDKFPQYAELIRRDPLSLPDTQSLLRNGEALITSVQNYDGDKTHVFVVGKTFRQVYTVDLALEDIETLVARIRTGINAADGKLLPFDVAASHELYNRLLGPAEKNLKDVDHMIVVPGGGPIASIPFGLLATGPGDGVSAAADAATVRGLSASSAARDATLSFSGYKSVPWLARKYALTMLPSIASLKSLRSFAKATRADKPFMGFGDPILSARKGLVKGVDMVALFRGGVADVSKVRELPSLPDTSNELKGIAKYLGADEDALYLRERATESMVKKVKLGDYRVVAFSTHGLLPAETRKLGSVVEPALVMTPPEVATEEDDGLLTASEIAQLKLDADFVILSACNTAAGEKGGGESLSGLAKAFFYAGARSLLVSHWPVESKAATKLTTNLFKNLKDNPNLSRAEAYRRSMMSLASVPETSHPFFWAPFSVVGD